MVEMAVSIVDSKAYPIGTVRKLKPDNYPHWDKVQPPDTVVVKKAGDRREIVDHLYELDDRRLHEDEVIKAIKKEPITHRPVLKTRTVSEEKKSALNTEIAKRPVGDREVKLSR